MTPDPEVVTPEEPIPVTSDGRLVGVVAQADIATANEIPKEQVADVVEKVSEPGHPAR